ncbi:hypothetical protein ACMFMG_003766 [Clarireedia jacksonii]
MAPNNTARSEPDLPKPLVGDNVAAQPSLSLLDDSAPGENLWYKEDNEKFSVSRDSEEENSLGDLGEAKGMLWWPSEVGADVQEMKLLAQEWGSERSKQSTSKGLNPNLCIFCRLFFDTWSRVVEEFGKNESIWSLNAPFHDTIHQVQTSASRGCLLCTQFLIKYEKRSKRAERDLTFSGAHLDLYQARTVLHTFRSANSWYLVLKISPAERYMLLIFAHDPQLSPHLELDSRPDYSLFTKSISLHDGRKAMALAGNWLKDCNHNHIACSREKKTVLPNRLVRIDDGKVRLCPSTDLEDNLDYATLSHCWGNLNILRLLSSNIAQFLDAIPYNDLSETFRHAIEIARALGFSLLWIDTLCIIQDDPGDWERESGRMAMIYGMSSLNIAASAAPDGSLGCFFPRDTAEFQSIRVKVATNLASEHHMFDLIDRDLVYENIDNAPLSSRAWVVQERVLAPRNLYFGVSEIFWECAAKFSCETFPEKIPPELVSQDTYLPKKSLWQSWDRIASTYSAGSLTYPEDKSIAIAGIARRIHEETGYAYLAGLWRKNLESQLCWFVETRKPNMQPHELRVREMPSWSWLAVNAVVKVPLSTVLTIKLYIEIVDIVVTCDGIPVLDSFGLFDGGLLTIKTKYLLKCRVESTQPLSEDSWKKRVSFAHTEMVALINWDYEYCHDEPCVLLPVGHFDQHGGEGRILQEGILLRATGQENGQYERIGVLSVWPWSEPTSSLDNLLYDIFEIPDHLNCSECTITEQDYQSVSCEDREAWYKITII